VHKLVSTRGHDVFLYQHFDAVSQWLQKSERSNAVRAIAILYPAENLSLQHRHEREERQKYSEERENINQTRHDLDNPARCGGQPCQQPMLGVNEDLVDRLAHVGMKKTVN